MAPTSDPVTETLTEIMARNQASKPVQYCETYTGYLESMRDEPLRLLELGVLRGGSLHGWADYFPKARIIGVDRRDAESEEEFQGVEGNDRIRFARGFQDDADFLTMLSQEEAPEGWDIVIDDCSHFGDLTLASFHALFPLVRQGGLYIIEDWEAGYMETWPDGRRFDPSQHLAMSEDGSFKVHEAGISGFVKQLVDEVALSTIRRVDQVGRLSQVEWVHYYKGAVIMRKRAAYGTPLAT